MAKFRSNAKSKEELMEQIRQLKEKVRDLQDGDGQPPAKAQGLAGGLLNTLGKMVPGLDKLVQTASRMPEFHDRLAAIDEEIKRRFKDQPMRQASAGIGGRRQMGIPPAIRRGRPGRSTGTGTGSAQTTVPRGKYPQPRPPKVHISPETPAELTIDVFEEENDVLVIAEAPGLNQRDIAVCLDGRTLTISILIPSRQAAQRIELPCEVTGQPEISLTNGILHIKTRKADKP